VSFGRGKHRRYKLIALEHDGEGFGWDVTMRQTCGFSHRAGKKT